MLSPSGQPIELTKKLKVSIDNFYTDSCIYASIPLYYTPTRVVSIHDLNSALDKIIDLIRMGASLDYAYYFYERSPRILLLDSFSICSYKLPRCLEAIEELILPHQPTKDALSINQKLELLGAFKKNDVDGKHNHTIKNLDFDVIKNSKTRHQTPRNHFLNLLLLIANEYYNDKPKSSSSLFKTLPIDIISHIFSYLSHEMGKTQLECFSLARNVLGQYRPKIKEMLSTPGGINVFQKKTATNQLEFTFFKSTKTLCIEYEKFISDRKKKKAGSREERIKVLEKINLLKSCAKPYWDQHSSLYQTKEKIELRNSIKNRVPYTLIPGLKLI